MDLTNYTFSQSSIKEYLECGFKTYLKRVQKLEPTNKESHYGWMGNVIHNSIYTALAKGNGKTRQWKILDKQKDARGVKFFEQAWTGNPTTPEFKSVYDADIGKRPEFFTTKKNVKAFDISENVEETWKEKSLEMIKTGLEMAKNINIVEIEKTISLSLLKQKFIGYVDILAQNEMGEYEFYDLKSGWNYPNQDKMQRDLQFILYSVSLKQLLKLDYYPQGFYMHLRSNRIATFTMDDAAREWGRETFEYVIENMGANVFTQAESYMRNQKCPMCVYRAHCWPGEYHADR